MNDEAPETDGELVERVRAGCDRAFDVLMARYKERLYRVIRRHIADREEAYDLLQDAFVSAWSALERFDTTRRFDVWLIRIALNKCHDWGRRKKVRALISLRFPEEHLSELTDGKPSPETIASDREVLQQLDSAIAALPAKLKDPLILTAVEGLSHKDAGEVLGVSAKAIEVRVYRARQRLAQQLQPKV
ncbi:MAG: RNA polymerase sigma factor [Sphingomonadales bacterium]